jgi:hypothetical protein
MTTTSARSMAWAALFYTALTAVLAWPLSRNPGGLVVSDNPDTHLFVWTLAWNTHALVTNPLHVFEANIYYPMAHTLAYSENLIGLTPFAAPIIWLTGNMVLAMNVAAMAACAVSGLGAFLLARTLGAGVRAALIGGLVFVAAPPHFFRLGQLHLIAVHWIPFGLAFLHRYLDGGRPRDARLAIAAFTAQAWTSGHGAVMLGVAMLALTLFRLVLGEPLTIVRRLRDIGWQGLLLVAPCVPLLLPYRAVQQEVGLYRPLSNYLPTPQSYLSSPSHLHRWVASWFTSTPIDWEASAWLFPGVLPVLLMLLGLALTPAWTGDRSWRAHLRRDPVMFYALLTLCCVLFFLPPPIGLWPYLYQLPGFNFIRVPTRFMILAMLTLACAAALGFERATMRLAPARQTLAALLCAAALVGEYASMPLHTEAYGVRVPAIDAWLATQPPPFAVAELPMPRPVNFTRHVRWQTTAMLHATAHWQKTIHGYSGIQPALHDELFEELTRFPDDASLEHLRAIGVTHIVVHTDQYDPVRWAEVEPRLAARADLELLHEVDGGRVYRIR